MRRFAFMIPLLMLGIVFSTPAPAPNCGGPKCANHSMGAMVPRRQPYPHRCGSGYVWSAPARKCVLRKYGAEAHLPQPGPQSRPPDSDLTSIMAHEKEIAAGKQSQRQTENTFNAALAAGSKRCPSGFYFRNNKCERGVLKSRLH